MLVEVFYKVLTIGAAIILEEFWVLFVSHILKLIVQ